MKTESLSEKLVKLCNVVENFNKLSYFHKMTRSDSKNFMSQHKLILSINILDCYVEFLLKLFQTFDNDRSKITENIKLCRFIERNFFNTSDQIHLEEFLKINSIESKFSENFLAI